MRQGVVARLLPCKPTPPVPPAPCAPHVGPLLVRPGPQCFGSIQHLKRRFGSGFTSELKLAPPTAEFVARVVARVETILGQATGGNLR